jgi:hypothetical protein
MTIEAVHSTSRAEFPGSTVWVPVATGLWAGNTAGNFIGLIEKVSTHGYAARNGRSEPVGLFSNLADAKRAVERL